MKGVNKMSDIELNDVNAKKLNRMKLEILKIEQENLKTREKSYDAMVEDINKIIVAEVKKCY